MKSVTYQPHEQGWGQAGPCQSMGRPAPKSVSPKKVIIMSDIPPSGRKLSAGIPTQRSSLARPLGPPNGRIQGPYGAPNIKGDSEALDGARHLPARA